MIKFESMKCPLNKFELKEGAQEQTKNNPGFGTIKVDGNKQKMVKQNGT